MNKTLKIIALFLIIFVVIIGCGNSSSSNSYLYNGKLIDAAVSNVEYRCGNVVGTTASDGSFSCPTSSVSFHVGGVTIGSISSIPADGNVMPQDIFSVARSETSNSSVILLARFLQSLDSDGNPDNGITLSSSTISKFEGLTGTIDQMNETSLSSLMNNVGVTLVSESSAKAHLENTTFTVEYGSTTNTSSSSTGDSSSNDSSTNSSSTSVEIDITAATFNSLYNDSGKRLDNNESNISTGTQSDLFATMSETMQSSGLSLSSARYANISSLSASENNITFQYELNDYNCTQAVIKDDLTLIASDSAGNQGTYYFSLAFECDTNAPSISTLSPADDSSIASASDNIVITFSKAVLAVSGKNINILKSSDDSTVETIATDSSKVTVSTSQVTINPDTTLDEKTEYYVQIEAGAFVDAMANDYAGISDTTSWSFTTADTTPPTITKISYINTSSTLTNGDTNIGPYTPHFKIEFSETVDATTINNTNINIASASGTVSHNADSNTSTYKFDSLPLSESTTYALTVSNVKDLAGNTITTSTTNFTTTKKKILISTGQTTVYATYDDGTYQKGAARSYTDNGDTVTDNATGLEWQDNVDYVNASNDANWSDAGMYCDNLTLNSQSDWRLPTFKELMTIADYTDNSDPYIDESVFDNVEGTYFWSSNLFQIYNKTTPPYAIWKIGFGFYGFSGTYEPTRTYPTRCAREDSVAQASILVRDDTTTGAEVVYDTAAGVMWQDDSTAKTASGTWANAIDYCENQIGTSGTFAGYSDWRLPNIYELADLMDIYAPSPYINSTFKNTHSFIYWSSTTAGYDTTRAVTVTFSEGSVNSNPKDNTGRYIRCIRNIQ